MSYPILRIILAIKLRTLNIDALVILVKVDITNRGSLVRNLIRNIYALKKGWRDEIHVLSWIGKQAKHAEEREGCHGARVVIARQASLCVIEAGWDVCDVSLVTTVHEVLTSVDLHECTRLAESAGRPA
jgi:hypothetical protein